MANDPMQDSQQVQCQLLIKSHPLFKQLPLHTTYELAGLFTLKNYHEHQVIVAEDDVVDTIYFIASGKAQVTRKFGELYATSLAILHPGDAIGLSAEGIYSPTLKRSATVTSLTQLTAYSLELNKFNAFVNNHPELRKKLDENAKKVLRRNFIQSMDIFKNLSDRAVTLISAEITEQSFPASTYIFRQDEQGDQCFLLYTGQVEIRRQTKNEDETLIATLIAPAIFGETAVLTGAKRNASVYTLEDCQVLVLDKQTLLTAAADNPLTAQALHDLAKSRQVTSEVDELQLSKEGWIIYP